MRFSLIQGFHSTTRLKCISLGPIKSTTLEGHVPNWTVQKTEKERFALVIIMTADFHINERFLLSMS